MHDLGNSYGENSSNILVLDSRNIVHFASCRYNIFEFNLMTITTVRG